MALDDGNGCSTAEVGVIYCTPAETPTSGRIIVVCAEEYFHSVGSGQYYWWQEEAAMRWFYRGVAAAPVHQGYPVPIPDFDKVAWAGGDISTILNSKVGELQPQYLSALHFYCLSLRQIVWVVARVVWWFYNTCDQEKTKQMFIGSTHLHCRSLVQGKVVSALAARFRIQFLNQENKSYQCHTDHSSICQGVHGCQFVWCRSSRGTQEEYRIGQEWAGLERSRLILGRKLNHQHYNSFAIRAWPLTSANQHHL